MYVAAVANGELPDGQIASMRSILDAADLVIAADGGIDTCRAVGRWPDRLVGDLDSVSDELVDIAVGLGVEVHRFPTDKDATDLELAIAMAVQAGATELSICTPFGGRLDHELATIALATSERIAHLRVDATDGRRRIVVVRATAELALAPGATVSLIPWAGDVTGVTTEGLRWPLVDATLPLGSTWGISNVAEADAQSVAVTSGVLLAVSDSLEDDDLR